MTQRSRQSSEAKLAFLTVVISRTAFWGALGVITWMALTPRPPVAAHSPSDAIQHFVAFSYLTVVMWCAYERRMTLAQMIAALFLYGAGIEVIQYFVPNRYFSLSDLAADTLGITIGAAIVTATNRILARLRHDSTPAV